MKKDMQFKIIDVSNDNQTLIYNFRRDKDLVFTNPCINRDLAFKEAMGENFADYARLNGKQYIIEAISGDAESSFVVHSSTFWNFLKTAPENVEWADIFASEYDLAIADDGSNNRIVEPHLSDGMCADEDYVWNGGSDFCKATGLSHDELLPILLNFIFEHENS